jgi:ubiquinone/menaquinone biosynthesis C-methylase UbiE
MTDIFTHSVIVSNLGPYWRNNMNILEVGTGHGYLAFLIAAILEKKGFKDYKINGLDINEVAINFCKDLQS